jgi:hypothetical protein
MVEGREPQTPEEEAALREVAAKHWRRHRWVALVVSVLVSIHTTVILHTIWHGWPLNARDLGRLTFFVINALVGLGLLGWGLRCLRADEAMDRQGKLQAVRWQAETRAWRQPWEERRQERGDEEAQ